MIKDDNCNGVISELLSPPQSHLHKENVQFLQNDTLFEKNERPI
jgi:hypothetical protein